MTDSVKGMKIKTRLSVIIAVAFLIYFILIASLVAYLLKSNSDEFYTRWLENDRKSLETIFDREFKDLAEVYYHAINQNADLSEIARSHEYSYIIFFDRNGNILRVAGNPLFSDSIPDSTFRDIASLAKAYTIPLKGFFYDNGLYMLYSVPVYENGSYKGYTTVLRKFTDDDMEYTKSVLDVDILEFQQEKVEKNGEVSVFYPVYDPKNNLIGYFRLAYINDIDPLIVQSYQYGLLASGTILLVTIVALTQIIDRTFLKRLEVLKNFMENISRRGFKTGERVKLSGDDEIRILADSINSALNVIEHNNKRIEGLSENLRIVNKALRHDLINDLSVIRGFAELAMENQGCDYCPRIVERVDKAVNMIRKMKEVEKTISSRDFSTFRISEVIASVMQNYDIKWSIYGDARVMADFGIYSVFENLISNAVKHGKTDRMKFEVLHENGEVTIRTIDYGVGIPEEIRDRIFDEGFTTSSGQGIGLFIVKKLIEKYGGSVSVQKNEPSGTVFTIKLKSVQDNNQ